ncbi:MAG: carbamoyl-phosphate synthase large subunit [Candidatus Moranbacteria bacterium]|nr:carbamoyl-phosphate synthase large subunit [Candidatus Moranbacteria bacterium]
MQAKKIQKVLILGSGGLKIGQAGEFDYSGSQAIKALKEENIVTILINPNIATVQTDKGLADKIYFLPVKTKFVRQIIEKEKPDSILLSFGGQTALNCGLDLYRKGILKKNKVRILGTPVQTIEKTEDRDLFVKELDQIKVETPKSIAVNSKKQAFEKIKEIGFPMIVRAAYSLGGKGSGFAKNKAELTGLLDKAFNYSKQVLLEESLKGWKEVEYEVVRDKFDNCVTVCNMENFDPLGVHTGESIVVAPSQTLDNREYHFLRTLSIKIIRHLGIVGECNIQFALNPKKLEYRVIEVNARLSRSSALASKATGYPLAYVAAKLALGKKLYEIKNAITKKTFACFEPALDYLVLKFPRWDLNKFRRVDTQIGSEMKSVGEVMAIGRSFEEIIQKAIRMLQTGSYGFTDWSFEFKDLKKEIKNPTPRRIFAIAKALEEGWTVEKISRLSQIDSWFIHKLKKISDYRDTIDSLKKEIEFRKIKDFDEEKIKTGKYKKHALYKIKSVKNKRKVFKVLLEAKKLGFSDAQIGWYLFVNESQIRVIRKKLDIRPFVKQIDTLAAEFPAQTNYLYFTYHAVENDLDLENKKEKKAVVLGSGPYCIGSSVEFDWCCVNTIRTFRKNGYKTVMINYNPETVSTDYDECDKLYFDELSEERVLDVWDFEKPQGLVVSMGGQIPNNLALKLHKEKVRIFGTKAVDIDKAEDRHKFSSLLDKLKISQPKWNEFSKISNALKFSEEVGYPVLVRPSYVLSGLAMSVAYNKNHLKNYLKIATQISFEHPVVVSKFEINAKEIEVDAVAQNGKILIYAIGEHVENAGVHSGDATIVLPGQKLYLETIRRVKRITKDIARELKITGPFNIQFLAKANDIKVIECNLRASRSFPFSSKITGYNFIRIASQAMMNKYKKKEYNTIDLDYVGVKAPQFSFSRLKGADPVLGVEMTSTGEVASIGDSLEEAFLKSMYAVNFKKPKKNIFISIGPLEAKLDFVNYIQRLKALNYNVYCSKGTARVCFKKGVKVEFLDFEYSPKKEQGNGKVLEHFKAKNIRLVINIPKDLNKKGFSKGYYIRTATVDANIPLINNLQLAKLLVRSLEKDPDLKIKSWDEYLNYR